MTAQIYDDNNLARLAVDWMTHDVAGSADAERLEQILAATGRKRPRSRWVALLKEPPMRIQTQVAVGTPARRPILLLAGLGLLILALAAAIVGAQLIRTSTPDGDWQGLRGDSTHSGLAVRGPVGRPVVTWQYRANAPVNRSIAIAGDLVYAFPGDGKLQAIGLADGNLRWSVPVNAEDGGNGPAVVNGVVYALDADGHLLALNAQTGESRWQSSATAAGPSVPAVGNGFVYVGTEQGELVAFDPASGAERWRTQLSTDGRVNNPATDDEAVYASVPGAFVALDGATGTERWRVDTGTDVTATAVVVNGIAYIGGGESDLGHLRAIDAKTGQPRWTIDEPLFSPTVAAGVAYVSDTKGSLAAIDSSTGTFRWRIALKGTVRPPAYAGGVLYVPADGEQRIYAIDAVTGGELWHFDLDGSNQCCISVAKGSVFVGTVVGTVYRISGDGANLTPAPIVAAPPATATPPPTAPATEPPAIAEFVSKSTGPGQMYEPDPGIAFDPEGRIWVPDATKGRFAVFEPDGMFVEYWGTPGSGDGQFDLTRENTNGLGDIAFAADGSFYVLDAGNERVQKFSADRTFVQAWGSFGLGPGQFNDPISIEVDAAGTVLVLDDVRGVLERYSRDGEVLGQIDVFSNARAGFNASGGFTLDAAGNIYVSQTSPFQITKFSPKGELLATFGASGPGAFHGWPGAMAVDSNGRLFVSQGDPGRGSTLGVVAFAGDGTSLGGFGPVGTEPGSLMFPGGVLVNDQGTIYIVDFGDVDKGLTGGSLQLFRLLPPLAP